MLSTIRGRCPLLVMVLMIVPLIGACTVAGIGEDEESENATPTAASEAATSGESDSQQTPTEAEPATATATPEPSATATDEPTATATETPAPTATPTVTPTATPVPPTPTPDLTVQNPFSDLTTPETTLDNYTMRYVAEFTGLPDAGDARIEIQIQQHSAENYHMLVTNQTEGVQTEFWVVDGTSYVAGPDGSVTQMPGMADQNLLTPGAYMIMVPTFEQIQEAERMGTETIEGQETVHYVVESSQMNTLGVRQDQTVQNPEGQMDIWVHAEQGYMVKMLADVSWTGPEGAQQTATFDYLVSQVGSTAEIAPPV